MTRARIIRTYMVLAGMYTFAASLIWSVNTLFLLDAGLAISEVFVVNALFSVGMIAFEIPTGVVADTLGRRLSYLLSVAVLAVTTVLYVIAGGAGAGWVVFGLISVLMGLGFTFFSGALEAWLVDGLNSVDVDRTDGGVADDLDHVFARGQQVSGASMFVGTILGGFLGQWNLSVPYVARAIVLVLVFAVAARLMVEIGFTPKRLRPREVPRQMREQAAVGIAYGWGQRGLRLLMISGSIRGVFFGWAFYASQPYFLELLGRDAVWVVGLVTAGVSLATIAGNQLVDVFSRRCGRRTTMLISASAVSTVAAVVIGLTSTFAVAVAGLLVVAGAVGVMSPVRQSYLHHVTTSEHRATVVSFDAMVVSVGGAGGQIGLGAVADNRSFSAGYVVGGLFTALAVPVLFALRRVGGSADQIIGTRGGVDGTCPSGLPRDTGVQSIPVPAVVDR